MDLSLVNPTCSGLSTSQICRVMCGPAGKESACNVGDLGSIPGLGRSPGERKGYPLQYSAWRIPWTCIADGVTKSQTWLSDFTHSLLGIRKVKVKFTLLCQTLCDPMDCIVHGILQARILEWVAFPFSRASSQPRDWIQVARIVGGFFTSWATREAQMSA